MIDWTSSPGTLADRRSRMTGGTRMCILAGVLCAAVALCAVPALARLMRVASPPLPAPAALEVLKRETLPAPAGRVLERLQLGADHQASTTVELSLPTPLPTRPLPLVVVLGGHQLAAAGLSALHRPGENAVLFYTWPSAIRHASLASLLRSPMALFEALRQAPVEIAEAMLWAGHQTWADADRISLLGFSLGAEAAPAAAALAAGNGRPAQWLVLAYGGAPLAEVVATDPRLGPQWIRTVVGLVVGALLPACEPVAALARIKARTLVIEGEDDRTMPRHVRDALWDAVRGPKTRVVLAGDHLGNGPHREARLKAAIDACMDWLEREGALNPAPAS